MSKINYCKKCEEYTIQKKCKTCDNDTILKNPPRYSPQDHYGEYRRKLKKNQKK